MTNLVLPDKGSHWYTFAGKPCYEIPMTTKVGMRPPNITDAKKLGLVPSVTTIMGVVSKPALEAWKLTQAILSALTLPQLATETSDAFAKRVVQDMREEGKQAASKGTDIHDLVESIVKNKAKPTQNPDSFVSKFVNWYADMGLQVQATEQSFALTDHGFGGRVDYIGFYKGKRCILDWKTQQTKAGQEAHFYPEYGCQLAAYGVGIFGLADAKEAVYLSACISRNEVGRIDFQEFEFAPYWDAFEHAKALWYSPLGPGAKLKKEEFDGGIAG